MAQNNPEQEPSIEEILASIRQIISDDDEEDNVAEPEEEAEPEPEPVAKAKPESEPEEEDEEILELTDKVDGDEDEELEEEYEPEPPRVEIDLQDSADYEDEPEEDDDDDSLLTDSAQHAVLEGISALASKTALDRKGTGATTIEDIVREMMKPMLREWLDIHLPPMIEKIVQKELRKIARRAVEDEE